jgi:hypothetical protein
MPLTLRCMAIRHQGSSACYRKRFHTQNCCGKIENSAILAQDDIAIKVFYPSLHHCNYPCTSIVSSFLRTKSLGLETWRGRQHRGCCAVEICWEMRLRPDLSYYRRALVNHLLATFADPKAHDCIKFAQATLHLVQLLQRESHEPDEMK